MKCGYYYQKTGFAQIFVLVGMLLVAISLPITTKLVQQNQENRSNAITSRCSSSETKCTDGYKYICSSSKWKKTTTKCGTTSTTKSAAATAKAAADAKAKAAKVCIWTCETWTNCTSGRQTCTSQTSSPPGCTGGIKLTSKSCTGAASATTTATSTMWYYFNGTSCIGKPYANSNACKSANSGKTCYGNYTACESANKKNETSTTINCSCGSASGGSYTSKPTSGLCIVGSAGWKDQTGSSGSYTWSCTGSNCSPINCSASKKVTTSATTACNPKLDFPKCDGANTLVCKTDGTGWATTPCGSAGCDSSTGRCNTVSANNCVCGSASGGSYTSKPTSGLCIVGSAGWKDQTGSSGSYTWSCTGSNCSPINCSASKKVATTKIYYYYNSTSCVGKAYTDPADCKLANNGKTCYDNYAVCAEVNTPSPPTAVTDFYYYKEGTGCETISSISTACQSIACYSSKTSCETAHTAKKTTYFYYSDSVKSCIGVSYDSLPACNAVLGTCYTTKAACDIAGCVFGKTRCFGNNIQICSKGSNGLTWENSRICINGCDSSVNLCKAKCSASGIIDGNQLNSASVCQLGISGNTLKKIGSEWTWTCGGEVYAEVQCQATDKNGTLGLDCQTDQDCGTDNKIKCIDKKCVKPNYCVSTKIDKNTQVWTGNLCSNNKKYTCTNNGQDFWSFKETSCKFKCQNNNCVGGYICTNEWSEHYDSDNNLLDSTQCGSGCEPTTGRCKGEVGTKFKCVKGGLFGGEDWSEEYDNQNKKIRSTHCYEGGCNQSTGMCTSYLDASNKSFQYPICASKGGVCFGNFATCKGEGGSIISATDCPSSIVCCKIEDKIDGICNTPNVSNGNLPSTDGLCLSGEFSFVSYANQKYSWTCTGSKGGKTANCSVNIKSVTSLCDGQPIGAKKCQTAYIFSKCTSSGWETDYCDSDEGEYCFDNKCQIVSTPQKEGDKCIVGGDIAYACPEMLNCIDGKCVTAQEAENIRKNKIPCVVTPYNLNYIYDCSEGLSCNQSTGSCEKPKATIKSKKSGDFCNTDAECVSGNCMPATGDINSPKTCNALSQKEYIDAGNTSAAIIGGAILSPIAVLGAGEAITASGLTSTIASLYGTTSAAATTAITNFINNNPNLLSKIQKIGNLADAAEIIGGAVACATQGQDSPLCQNLREDMATPGMAGLADSAADIIDDVSDALKLAKTAESVASVGNEVIDATRLLDSPDVSLSLSSNGIPTEIEKSLNSVTNPTTRENLLSRIRNLDFSDPGQKVLAKAIINNTKIRDDTLLPIMSKYTNYGYLPNSARIGNITETMFGPMRGLYESTDVITAMHNLPDPDGVIPAIKQTITQNQGKTISEINEAVISAINDKGKSRNLITAWGKNYDDTDNHWVMTDDGEHLYELNMRGNLGLSNNLYKIPEKYKSTTDVEEIVNDPSFFSGRVGKVSLIDEARKDSPSAIKTCLHEYGHCIEDTEIAPKLGIDSAKGTEAMSALYGIQGAMLTAALDPDNAFQDISYQLALYNWVISGDVVQE